MKSIVSVSLVLLTRLTNTTCLWLHQGTRFGRWNPVWTVVRKLVWHFVFGIQLNHFSVVGHVTLCSGKYVCAASTVCLMLMFEFSFSPRLSVCVCVCCWCLSLLWVFKGVFHAPGVVYGELAINANCCPPSSSTKVPLSSSQQTLSSYISCFLTSAMQWKRWISAHSCSSCGCSDWFAEQEWNVLLGRSSEWNNSSNLIWRM